MNLPALIPFIAIYLGLALLVFGLLAAAVIVAWLVAEHRRVGQRRPGVRL